MALCYVPFLFLDFCHGCFIRYVQQKGQSNNRCKFIVNENMYFADSCKHWIILKNFIINLLKKLLAYVSFVSKYYCCFQKKICYFFSLCFILVAIAICILSAVTSISLKTKGFLLTFMTDPGNSFYIVWKGGKIALGSDLWRITSQEKDLFPVLSFTNNLSKCYKIYSWN